MRLYLPGGILKRPEADVSDITTAKRTGRPYWDPAAVDWLVIPFDKEPTKGEADRIRRRITTANAAEEAQVVELVETRKGAKTKTEQLLLDAELSRRGQPKEA